MLHSHVQLVDLNEVAKDNLNEVGSLHHQKEVAEKRLNVALKRHRE